MNRLPGPFMPLDAELADYCRHIERNRRAYLIAWRSLVCVGLLAAGYLIGRMA